MKKIYLLLTAVFFMASCEKTALPSLEEQGQLPPEIVLLNFKEVPVELLKKTHLYGNYNSKTANTFGSINEDIQVSKITLKKGHSSYTFSLKRIKSKSSQQENYYFDNLVISEGKEVKSLIFRYEPTLDWLVGGKDFENYTGRITIYNTEGDILNSIYRSGEELDLIPAQTGKTVCHYELERVETWCFGDLCSTIYYYKETCTSGNSGTGGTGGGNGDGPGDPASLPSVPIEGDPNWDYGGGGGGPETIPGIDDIKIQNNLDDPCAKKVFEQLRLGEKTNTPLTPNSQIPNSLYTPLSKEILDLFNNHKTVDYQIDENNIGRNYTYDRSGKVYTSLDSFYLSNASRLSIARTMIHEGLHAYLLLENSNQGSSLFQSLDNYARENGYTDANDIHHNFMGSYINAMTYSLYVWDLHYGTGGILNQHGNIDVNYYRAMAFGGFYKFDSNGSRIDYDSFIKLAPNQTERNNIVQIIKNEQDGSFLAKGDDC